MGGDQPLFRRPKQCGGRPILILILQLTGAVELRGPATESPNQRNRRTISRECGARSRSSPRMTSTRAHGKTA